MLPPLDWSEAERSNSIELVTQHALQLAQQAVEWYMVKRRPMKFWGRILRLGSICLLAAAGVIPILATIAEVSDKELLHPLWASVALVLSGTLILIDRYVGCSAAWSRYMNTALALGNLVEKFQLDQQMWRLNRNTDLLGAEQATVELSLIQTFVDELQRLVRDEANQWTEDFGDALRGIEAATKNARQQT